MSASKDRDSVAVSIILPTYNEAANIPELLKRIAGVGMKAGTYEVIVVDDDSPDQTWHVAEELRAQYPMLRVLRRVGRRGLSSAVTEGFAWAKGRMFVVMDADLQHDPAVIQQLVEGLKKGADIAVASRYTPGGSVGEWITGRRILSQTATFLARKVPPVEVSDPMSGFFAIKREAYEQTLPHVRPTGFKILLEILAFLPATTKTAEVPLTFQMRHHGESKLSLGVELIFLWQLLRIVFHRMQWWLFWLIIIGAFALTAPRAAAILPIYMDTSVRTQVQQTLERITQEQGWLLSDIALQSVSAGGMRIMHRFHHRGADETACYKVRFDNVRLSPCAD